MTLDKRSRNHIQAVADEFNRGATDEALPAHAGMFLAGVVTGLSAAVQIADGAPGEKAVEDISHRLTAAIGQAYLEGKLPAQPPAYDGPTVAECAAADRNWDVEKDGE